MENGIKKNSNRLPEHRKKSFAIQVRCTKAEKEMLSENSKLCDMTISEYVLKKCLQGG